MRLSLGKQVQKKRNPGWSRPIEVVAVAVAGAWLWTGMFVHVRDVEATSVYPAFEVRAEPLALMAEPGQVVRGKVRSGQSMFSLLSRHGLDQSQVLSLVRVAKPIKDLARLRAGQPYRVRIDEQGNFRTFEVDLSSSRMLRVSQTPFGFFADTKDIAFESRVRAFGGTAEKHLFEDLVKVNGGVELVHALHDIFAWEIDFDRDIRKGDSYRMLVEEVWRDGQFDHFGDVQYVQIFAQGNLYEAIRYNGEYYDPEGRSLRRNLLPKTVDYRYISSRFSHARRHPVTGRIRPHLGVDYVARYGTPIHAAGDGVVTYVGWKGDNGRFVSIRHNGSYRTVYAHLSRYGSGLRRGVAVKQGQIIGYVGNSGKSTGTHLHYGVYKDGRAIDPLKIRYVSAVDPIDLISSPEFQVAWDQARLTLVRLESTPEPEPEAPHTQLARMILR